MTKRLENHWLPTAQRSIDPDGKRLQWIALLEVKDFISIVVREIVANVQTRKTDVSLGNGKPLRLKLLFLMKITA